MPVAASDLSTSSVLILRSVVTIDYWRYSLKSMHSSISLLTALSSTFLSII